jgi:hypothetical protein
MVEEIATLERLDNFLPTLAAVFADAGLLLVLDNLETLLTPDGQWRDRRWVPLIGALTSHQGPSRVILTSRNRAGRAEPRHGVDPACARAISGRVAMAGRGAAEPARSAAHRGAGPLCAH